MSSVSALNLVYDVGAGNSLASTVVLQLLEATAQQGWKNVATLEQTGLRGGQIWVLYKHICGESTQMLMVVLLAVRLFLLEKETLCTAVENRGDGFDVNNVLLTVRKYLEERERLT